MNSLRLRLTLWFGCSFAVVVLVFVALTYRALDLELRQKSVPRDYPEHPEWRLHGSFSREEVRDITGELLERALMFALPAVAVALFTGYLLARKSLRPIAEVNRQLMDIQPRSLNKRIELKEADVEFKALVSQVNDLLGRLDASFSEMREYAAKVAHELRTPLSILRLKIEQSAGQIAPELADELQEELQRLTHVVDQSLLIAKAEQGRLTLERRRIELSALLRDVVEDFRLLAADRQRRLTLEVPAFCPVEVDPRFFKQALHALLANALKHGGGEIRVRLRVGDGVAALTISNYVRPEQSPAVLTLGLGLRVVSALLRVENSLRWRRRKLGRAYSVRVLLPVAEAPSRIERLQTALVPVIDPVI